MTFNSQPPCPAGHKSAGIPTPFDIACAELGVDHGLSGWPDHFGEALRDRARGRERPVILSLFSGAGGLDIGFSDAGFDIVECVEIEKKFCDTLLANADDSGPLSGTSISCSDIRDYVAPDSLKIDLIIGGPPCQTFSAAGRRANGVPGTSDQRGTLFREYVRLLSQLQPVGFLFENVYGIVGAQNGEPWREIVSAFKRAGYSLSYRILDAADYGVPQHRERLFIVGHKIDEFQFPRPTHGPDSPGEAPFYDCRTAIASVSGFDDAAGKPITGRFSHLIPQIPPGLNYSFFTEEMGHPEPIFAWRSKFSDFMYKADPARPVRTIKAQPGQYTGPFHWDNRMFSTAEYKRLQTFPDSYRIVGSTQVAVQQIGNSVAPQIARILALAVRGQLFGDDLGISLPTLEASQNLGFRARKRLLTSHYREVARAAHAGRTGTVPSFERPDIYYYFATLGDGFTLVPATPPAADFRVSVAWPAHNQMDFGIVIKVDDIAVAEKPSEDGTTIVIKPTGAPWSLNASSIRLQISSTRIDAYTVAWKALERELVERGIKADLVQLCGYYQYTPRFESEFSSIGHPGLEFLTPVVSGDVVGTTMPADTLAQGLGVAASELPAHAQRLRQLGYEIRNQNTNPQIPTNNWLIPYHFPTLNKMSVQLHKQI